MYENWKNSDLKNFQKTNYLTFIIAKKKNFYENLYNKKINYFFETENLALFCFLSEIKINFSNYTHEKSKIINNFITFFFVKENNPGFPDSKINVLVIFDEKYYKKSITCETGDIKNFEFLEKNKKYINDKNYIISDKDKLFSEKNIEYENFSFENNEFIKSLIVHNIKIKFYLIFIFENNCKI